ncbi:hypothetical protein ACJ73_01071 [Blastomyces percursus]|uniref:Uncharacterized protein n=1 Tax=Blastomyces percursus TaxID=1658174 RepID=A0A1J9RIU3_9EURO|nr:hypothetical protein ACJ73_01071 [Blastomyces percursus]
MALTTRSRTQSADLIGGFPVESIDNQENTPPPTAVRIRAAASSANNDDRSPTPMRGPAAISAAEECEKAEIEPDNLRLRLELMNQSNSNQSNPPDSPISHLHGQAPEYNLDSVIGKKIATFFRTAKLVLKPINLNGSSNYLVWRESVLSRVETARCHLILNNKEEDSPFEKPVKRSAYLLWHHIEIKFRRPLEEERRHLFHQICTISHTNDRDFIKRLQDLRTKLVKINFPLPEWQILDILYKGLYGSNLREFIQTKIEAKRTSRAVAVTLDIDTLLDEISTRLPTEINQSKSIDPPSPNQIMTSINHLPASRAVAAAAGANPIPILPLLIILLLPILFLLANVAATAAAMVMKIHPATIRTPICAQHGKYTKNSPAILNDNQDIQYASAAIPMGLNTSTSSFQIAY